MHLYLRGILVVGLCAGLAACAPGPHIDDADILDDVETRYQHAIAEAEHAEPADIITTLVAIHPDNDALTWMDTPGESPVLVVNWTDTPPSATPGDSITTDDDVWVTVAPKVQRFCQDAGLGEEALNMRLRQVLGLPPDAPYTHFVAYWVTLDDLFRPCPDPQITDRDCELDFPGPEHLVKVSREHKDWFEELKATSYASDGYPWTRLGYTYDWGNTDTPVGFSEFVITPDATVQLESVTETEAYCER